MTKVIKYQSNKAVKQETQKILHGKTLHQL